MKIIAGDRRTGRTTEIISRILIPGNIVTICPTVQRARLAYNMAVDMLKREGLIFECSNTKLQINLFGDIKKFIGMDARTDIKGWDIEEINIDDLDDWLYEIIGNRKIKCISIRGECYEKRTI